MIKKIYFRIFIICFFFLYAYGSYAADKIESIYKEHAAIERSGKISRASYARVADKFYKIYYASPKGAYADEALLGAARVLRKSYERFHSIEDRDKALRYYNLLQGSFTSKFARDSYIECAEMFSKSKDTASAKFILNKLITKHPNSSQAGIAKEKLAALEKKTGKAGLKPSPEKTPAKTVISNTKTPPAPVAAAAPAAASTPAGVLLASVSHKPDKAPSSLVAVKNVRYFSAKEYTRVVVDISEDAPYQSHWLKEDPNNKRPPRLTVDIGSSFIEKNVNRDISIKDGLLSSVRLGVHKDNHTWVVLDSENVKDFSIFRLPNPDRIVIDVFSSPRDSASSAAAIISSSQTPSKTPAQTIANLAKDPPAPSASQAQSNITLGAALGLKIKTIVIDPGHGGKDPGATYFKLQEKDIVLDIAKYLKEYLKQDKSLKLYMTRDTDIFIPLEERTALANKWNADIFVSVHANAAANNKASGIETFVFNVTNDRAALDVAAFENQATTKSLSDLQGILKDILKYSKLEESLSLAGSVQNKAIASTGLDKSKNLGVKQAPFYVLVGARMPAILVETGFISNKEEADRMRSAAYRKKIAKGIYDGIKEYIVKYNGK